MQPVLQPTPYEQPEALPPALIGEILNAQLHTQPRPTGPHARVASRRGLTAPSNAAMTIAPTVLEDGGSSLSPRCTSSATLRLRSPILPAGSASGCRCRRRISASTSCPTGCARSYRPPPRVGIVGSRCRSARITGSRSGGSSIRANGRWRPFNFDPAAGTRLAVSPIPTGPRFRRSMLSRLILLACGCQLPGASQSPTARRGMIRHASAENARPVSGSGIQIVQSHGGRPLTLERAAS